MTSIKLEDIKEFSKKYNQDIGNKEIENKIKEEGLIKACLNKEIIEENEPNFNIELSETKRYNQKDSLRCWAFSGFNMIKRNIAENLNIDIINFELSDNYIIFFHRLEKANLAYEKTINSKSTDIMKIFKKVELKDVVEEVGHWQTFVNIVKKYRIGSIRSNENYNRRRK